MKARGISVARLDHTGFADPTRAKGSSDKGTDVDVGWVIHKGDRGALRLEHHGLTRLSSVPEHLDLVMTLDPLTFRRALRAWPPGTADWAKDLDALGLPLDVSGNTAQKALRAAGVGRNRVVVLARRGLPEGAAPCVTTWWDGTTRNHLGGQQGVLPVPM